MNKTAFLFAGQGAQTVGMGKDVCEALSPATAVYNLGERLLPGVCRTCFDGDAGVLNRTENTQPCLFLTDLAIAESLRAAGIVPDAVAGFSLGEIPALSFSGVLSAADAFRFVVRRGQSMSRQAELHPGGMVAALKLSAETVNEICGRFREVWPVNYNCPGQVSCAGNVSELDDFCLAIKEAGGRAVKLAVSGAFHTPYMSEVVPELRAFLDKTEIFSPDIPVYANRTGELYASAREEVADCLSRQVASPVRWEKILRSMWESGIRTFIEVGAGSTLTGFVRRTLPEAKALTVNDVASYNQCLEQVKREG